MSEAVPKPSAAVERMIQAPGGRLHVTDHAGSEPALVVMHGFPDDSRIYDRLTRYSRPVGWWPWTGSAMAVGTHRCCVFPR